MKRSHSLTVRRERRGFTLMEVLIVLAILGVLAAMVVPQLIGTQRKANEDATAASIKSIETALELYAVANQGRYPEGGQEVLEQLTLPTTDERTGRSIEPYLPTVPLDAWQQPFWYEFPTSKIPNNQKPAIWSSGFDGQNDEGNGDDINNWFQYL